ncbi:zwei Ig domain protein zig-4 [Aplysia californica]|uniref:Zwei Ig domain protein zig-4 n=1 Tax=Aplysia californica TaxID=6500 RepID=A0ABM0ZYF6_APLCA|nr:zwei Ig domain protein zig-4 [Aplysia californica]
MVHAGKLAVLTLCLIYLPNVALAFFKKYGLQKRFGEIPGSRRSGQRSKLFFKGEPFEPVTVGAKHGSLVLECHVGGSPSPTVHWLKDGVRIPQGSHHTSHDDSAAYEDHNSFGGKTYLRLGSTKSRLYLDCLTEEDQGQYTCVAESPKVRKTQSTLVTVEKGDAMTLTDLEGCVGKNSHRKGAPARLYMWSTTRLEYQGAKVQLFCRAEGVPEPRITWYDPSGKPITEDEDRYRLAKNGDLILRDISWFENMGRYTCEADNGYGTDSADTFLYPTLREDDMELPL